MIYSASSALLAANWPTYRHDAQRAAYTREQAYPPLTEMWSFSVQGDILSSPVVSNGILYVGTRADQLYALNALTGEVVWDQPTEDWIDATPAVSSGVVVVPCRDGKLYAWNAFDGTPLWQTALGGTAISSPLIYQGKVYVGAGAPSNEVKVFDLDSGSALFSYPTGEPVQSSPATDGTNVYFGSNDGKVYAFSKDSNTAAWGTPFPTMGSFNLNTVAISGATLYAAPGHDDHKVYKLNLSNGAQLDVSGLLDPSSGATEAGSPSVAEIVVYTGMGTTPHNIFALNTNDTGLPVLWTSPSLGNTTAFGNPSPPSIANDVIYVGGSNNTLRVFKISDGSQIAAVGLGEGIHSNPAVSNGWVYISTLGGSIKGFKASLVSAVVSPSDNDVVNGTVTIQGVAVNPSLSGYILAYGSGSNPSSWTTIISSSTTQAIDRGTLAEWDTSALTEGIYSLRLTVNESASSGTNTKGHSTFLVNHAPQPPTSVNVSDVYGDNGTRLMVSWTLSAEDGTGDLTGYRVYHSTQSGINYSLRGSVAQGTTYYQDTGLTADQSYYYIVKAHDDYQESSPSAEASGIPTTEDLTAPATITNLAADSTANAGEALLSWTAPGDDGSTGTVNHYTIRHTTDDAFDWTNLFDQATAWKTNRAPQGPSGTLEQETVTGLSGGVTYYFIIRSWDSAGNSSANSNRASFHSSVTPSDITPPQAPSSLTAQDTPADYGGSITLDWTLSPDDGGGSNDVTGYRVYRGTESGSYESTPLATLAAGTSIYTDSTATINIRFYYVVRALDSDNESTNSNESDAVSENNWIFVDAGSGGTVSLNDGTQVILDPGALSQNDSIMARIVPAGEYSDQGIPSEARSTTIVREFRTANSATTFRSLVTIKIPFLDSEISGMQEANLRLYTWDEAKNKWIIVNTSEVLASENKVMAKVKHFSLYRIMEFRPLGLLLDDTKVYTYPNPAKGSQVTFKFYLGNNADVTVDVYNVAGEKVGHLAKSNCPAGIVSEIVWEIGGKASGVYIYRLEAKSASGSANVTKKLAIIH